MKRKIKQNELSDNEKVKISKKSKTEGEDENVDQEEQIEPVIDFDVKHFRHAMKSESYFDEIKKFIKKAKNPAIIREFLNEGKPLDFVELLQKHEESSNEIVSALCQCFYLTISFIDNEENGISLSIAAPAVKFFVTKNTIAINKMISSSNQNDKVTIFKILAIAMNIDNELGHEILKNIEIFSKANEIIEIPFYEVKTGKQIPKDCPVRRALIELFLTFLFSEKSSILRKKILNRRQLFEYILRDLHRDSYETIKSLLTTMTKLVLISPEFGKPEKLKIFSEKAVKSLLKLYEWNLNENDKSSIFTIAHQFLLLLLTSKKHGIVIRALNENRQNQRQLQVINTFKNVWNFEYPSLLVIEIIKSCPELMQNILNKLVMGLLVTNRSGWIMCAYFTKKLLIALEPSKMFEHFAASEAKKISNNIIKLSISQLLLQNLNERVLIQQDKLEVRENALQLLHLMLDNCCKFMKEVKKITSLKDFEKHRIRFDIINHIFTFFPHFDVILNSLYRSINLSMKLKTEESEKLVKSQLISTLEIILLLTKQFPSTIERIPSVIDFLQVLKPIYEMKFSDQSDNLEIEMKIAKIILLLQPNILTLESEMFQRIFLIMIEIYCGTSSTELRKDAETIITGMLTTTSIFNESHLLEIRIWLEAFRSIKKGSLKEASTLFLSTLKSLKSKGDDCFQIQSTTDETCNFDLLNEIYKEEISDEIVIELSPVLFELYSGKSNKVNRVIEFVEIATIHFYHSFPQHKKVIMEQLNSELNTRISGYLKSKKIIDFHEFIGSNEGVFHEFSQAIINNTKSSINSNDVNQLQILIVQAIFYANQMNGKGNLDKEKSDLLNDYIGLFYNKIIEIETLTIDQEIVESTNDDEKDKIVNKIFDLTMEKPSTTIVNFIYQNEKLLTSFTIKESDQMTDFIGKIIKITNSHETFAKNSKRYKLKILTEIEDILSSGKLEDKVYEVVENFSFDFDDFFNLLTILAKQKSAVDKNFVQLLIYAMNSLTKLKITPISNELMKKIEKIYLKASRDPFIDVAEFDQALLDYLTVFPEINNTFSTKIFELACDSEWIPTKSFVKLLVKIFTLTKTWNEMFKDNLMNLKKEVMYPLIPAAIEKKIVTQEQLKQIYQDCKSGMLKAIEKPTKAAHIYRDNVETSLKLIELTMPLNECNDLTMKKYKFDSTQLFQLKMLQEISAKAFNVKNETKIFDKFINTWMKLFSFTDDKSIDDYLIVLDSWMKKIPEDHEADFDRNEDFENFIKICLKNGLKFADKSKLLKTLGKFVRSIVANEEEITKIFDMILTHSNFFNIVFNYKKSGRQIKANLFFLLNILVMKNPKVAQEKHVPIFLSSYQATLSPSDQLILNLLRFYEVNCGIDFHKFRPFLHGPLALSFYTTNEDQKLRLIDKEAEDEKIMIGKLLNTFEKSTIEKTMNNFPIDRTLNALKLNELDQLLNDDGNSDNEIYDPCYYLPLFRMIFNSSFGFTAYAVSHHLLALILPALSSYDENIRLLAASILLLCRENTEIKKKTNNHIWVRFYDSLQKGLKEISGSTELNELPKTFPRAASISTNLLAQFSIVLQDSLNVIYAPLSNYLAIRESFDFTTIPELLVLLQSSEIQYEDFRLFLLNIVKSGIKDDLDIKLINNTQIMKIMFFCYGSSLSSRKTDLIILQIFNQILVKTKKAEFLFDRHGFILWLMQAASKVEAFEYDLIEMMLILIENSQEAMIRENRNCSELFQILLILLKKLSKGKITTQGFYRFLKTLNLTRSATMKLANDDIELIHEFIKVFIPEFQMKTIHLLENSPENSPFDDFTRKIFYETRNFVSKSNVK